MAKRGRDQTHRVNEMIEQFIIYHKMGYSIPEIAEKFQVSTTTIYSHLQEIAEKNGYYDRKDLLERIHPKHNVSNVSRQGSTDFDEVLELASKVRSRISEVSNNIKTIEEDR